ncbi:MAG: OmpA family protein, partial [Candidatus Kapabacteria bacterium]|nr:OmpA family protein [Candidatus Kapabacteria bacterium]
EFFAQAQATAPDEISSEAIYRATQMSFRPNAQKIVLLITDDCALQENANHTEESLTKDLWNAGAQLYSVVNPAKHNAGIVTRLSLGRDYDIAQPFTEVLDNISGDITTTYEITYGPKPIVKPQVFVIRGTVTNDKSWAVGASIAANGSQGNSLSVKSNSITGNYEIVVPITKKDNFTAVASASGYFDEIQNINAQSVKVGDTLIRNFVMKKAVITLCGSILDEKNNGVQGIIRLENAQNNVVLDSVKTGSDGKYCFELPENMPLRLNVNVQDYISQPLEFSSVSMKKGEQVKKDIMIMSIDHAIATGATFKLKNIFFEFGKADITAASAPELQRLYDFLREYPKIRVEVSAHTDAVGSDEANMTLSNNRAKSVVQYLQRLGIDASRMVSQGYGETKPVGDNTTDEGRALNRRVEFKLIR